MIYLLIYFSIGVCMLVDFNSGYSRPSFGRRLLPNEVTGYSRAIKQGLNVLQKETGLIIHNSSVPSEKLFNTGIGSLLSNNAQKKFLPFIYIIYVLFYCNFSPSACLR